MTMASADENIENRILELINEGKSNNAVLKDCLVDLFTQNNPEKFAEINFDKGIAWPAHLFEVTAITRLDYNHSEMFGKYEVRFFTLAFAGRCRLDGWQRAQLTLQYHLSFSSVCSISLAGNHVAFKTIDETATHITEIKEIAINPETGL